jgi:ATP-binding cassette subfamily B protein
MSRDVKKNIRISPVLRAYTKASLRYPLWLGMSLFGALGLQVANVIAPLYLSSFVNVLSKGTPSTAIAEGLITLLVIYALIKIGGWVGQRVRTYGIVCIEAAVMADLQNDAFINLMHHGHNFFTSNFVGSLTRRVTRYARSYEQVFDSMVFNFIPTLLFAIGSIAILYTRNIWLGTALLIWVFVFLTVQIVMTRWRHPLRVERALEDSRMTGALSDAVGNQSVVALFSAEKYEASVFTKIVDAWRAIFRQSSLANAWINAVQGAFAILIEIVLLATAVYLWTRGLLSVGDFVLIQVYVLALVDQIWDIGNTLNRLYDAFADASEMVDILETPFEIQDVAGAGTLALTKGEIIFNETTFFFDDTRPVLDHFSLTINGGEKIALIGSSGAGKSTITKLLLRLYDLKGGTITIDGQDISNVTQESLRKHIAFVPQESTLFHRTLRENIRYGKQDASDAEVEEAAKKAHCHEFITTLSEGYDTLVGERGIKLSGGERQRITIARAILKNAPILILDEATSSLDSESEQLIQDALTKLMEGKTVIAIAHRLSTVMKMDRIIVVEDGSVTLSGTHDELLAHESNLYKKLWEIQAGGFIDATE